METKVKLCVTLMFIFFNLQNIAQVQNIAHRGCSSLAPENTYAAWIKAIEVGADYFELDIQISSDDSLMIMHDATVDRTTNGTGNLSSMTYAQLRLLDAGSWFSPEFAGEKIPTFAEALQLSKSNGIVDIVAEIKSNNSTVVEKVVAMIQAFGMQSRVIVSSFNFSQLTQTKSLDTTIAVQLFATITNAMIDQVAAINGEWVGSGGTITQAIINYAHSKGVLFNGWTINDAYTMRGLISYGIDGITTNYPQLLTAILDTSPPSDVIINSAIQTGPTDINLNWQPSNDPESGISFYQIFRDVNPNPSIHYTTVGDTNNYIDHTLIENETFYYRLKAINGAGLSSVNFSNQVFATTTTDLVKPTVSFVTSKNDSTTIYVEFSEIVDELSAETITNYSIDNGVVVLSADLVLDTKTIILKTSNLQNSNYSMTISNIKDRAFVPNVMLTTSLNFTHHNITSDYIAFYKLDETNLIDSDTLIFDSSPNANNGIIINGAVISSGYLGNSLSFDGVDDYVQFNSSQSFNINGPEVSVSLWTKLEYLPSQLLAPYGPLFDSETDQYVLYEDRGNNELRFKVSTSAGAERPGIPGADLVSGQWIHVAGVYNGSTAKIFLNGVLKDTHNLTGNVNPGQVAMLGKSGTAGTPSYFKGSIDNVEIFNRALSDVEVLEIFTNTKILANIINGIDLMDFIPDLYSLSQNYPNPFNPSTEINFGVKETGLVSLKVYDILGNLVKVLVDKEMNAGYYNVTFNAENLSSSVYFYKIQVNNFSEVKKMMLLR